MTDLYLNSFNIDSDVLCFTETWLNENVNNAEIFCNLFQVFRKDRLNCNRRKGGGVLIATKSFIAAEEISFTLPADIEVLGVKLTLNNDHIYVTCSYIPPNSNSEIYFHHVRFIEYICSLLKP